MELKRIKVLEGEIEDKEKTVELHRKRADAYRNEALGAKFDTLADVIKESITEGKYSQDNKVKQLKERIKMLEDAVKDWHKVADQRSEEIIRLDAERDRLKLENDVLESMSRHAPSPCGHSSQYAYTEDGGKHIVCLLCSRASHAALAKV